MQEQVLGQEHTSMPPVLGSPETKPIGLCVCLCLCVWGEREREREREKRNCFKEFTLVIVRLASANLQAKSAGQSPKEELLFQLNSQGILELLLPQRNWVFFFFF